MKNQKIIVFLSKIKKLLPILLLFAGLGTIQAKCPYELFNFGLQPSENSSPNLIFTIKNLSKKTISSFEVVFTLKYSDSISDTETSTTVDTEEEFSVFSDISVEPSEFTSLSIPLDLQSDILSSQEQSAEGLENLYIESIYLRQVFFQDKSHWKDLTGSYAEFF